MAGGAVVAPSDGPVVGEQRIFAKANMKPLLYCAITVVGAILYGYDGTYFTSILAMDKFARDYGTLQSNGAYAVSASDQSILTSAVQIGEFFGSLTASFIGDYFGRKGGFLGACAYVTVGVLIQIIPAGSVAALGTGRAILGMGVGVISNCTPLMLSELAPTPIRGIVVGSWQLLLAIGQVIGGCVGQGTHALTTTAAYRIPIGLNLFIVLIILLGLLILPESPRWLIGKGREEKALQSLLKINASQADPELVANAEFEIFKQAHRDQMEAQGESGWKTLLTGVERRKFVCVLGILICQQIGGVQFIFSYTTTFFQYVGVTNSFLVTIVVDIIEVVGVLFSFVLIPRFGRRALLLSTSVPMFLALFIVGALGCVGTRSGNEDRCIAAMICIYVFAFNLAWGPLAWVVASELATGVNRQKLMSLGTACFWIVAWAVTFTLPYLFQADEANLGPKIGFIYGVGTFIAMIFVYFYIPETFGRSLEEINEMLTAKVPTRQWKSYQTSINTAAENGQAGYKKNADGEMTPSESDDGLKAAKGSNKEDSTTATAETKDA